jgi:hypothetical protein
MHFSYRILKLRQREIRGTFSTSLSLRTHRALSWLNRAESETDDDDARFLFLWIAFNAAYANEIPDRKRFSEYRLLLKFLKRMVNLDTDNLLHEVLWEKYPGAVRLLIDNHYVFQPFWDYQNGMLEKEEMEISFARSKRSAHRALAKTNTFQLLTVVLSRLYTLRNQLIHGGATWNSSVNRSQVADGAHILGFLVPIVIHLMMENSEYIWGDPCYPVVE